MFDLAHGEAHLTLNLNEVPDEILERFVDWHNEKVEMRRQQ